MRRLAILLLVLWLTEVIAVPAEAASVVGSYHDLSSVNQTHLDSIGWQFFDDYNEVCVYCHTPHQANPSGGPLWNRADNTTTFTTYASSTLDAAPNQPGIGSRLCLSCHDGSVAVDALVNAPPPDADDELSAGHGHMVDPWQQTHIDCSFCHKGTAFGDFSGSYFGSSLADQHPVGITYPASTDLVDAPTGGTFSNGIKLIGGKVECASCHNPHDPEISPFLRVSNAGSALCYTCHRK